MVRSRTDAALLFSWFAGPAAAYANQVASYAMGEGLRGGIALHLLTVVAILVTLAGGVAAARILASRDGGDGRRAFMGRGGLLLSGISLLVIIAQEIYKLSAPWSAP
jgi:hypothetical protein